MSASQPLDVVASQLWTAVRSAAVFVAIAAVVYLPGRFVVVPALKRAETRVAVDETITNPFVKIVNVLFAVFALYLAVTLSGLATTPTITAAMAAGATIAIGFAAQDVLGNLVSGVFLVADPGFHIGDWIEWDDKEGVIEDISFRVTRVHTFDNELITVPNAELTDNAVTNPVAKDRRRISYEFAVGYDDDIDEARAILIEEAAALDDALDRPAPTARVKEFAESYVELQARFWIAHPVRADFVRTRSTYAQAVKERFDEAGIEMPYPYRQLTGTIGTRDETGTPRSG